MTLTAEVRIRVASNVFGREFDGEMILVDLNRGDYYGLDTIGTRAWEGLSSGRTPREIAATLIGEYAVEASRIEADLVRLVQDLLDHGLVERR